MTKGTVNRSKDVYIRANHRHSHDVFGRVALVRTPLSNGYAPGPSFYSLLVKALFFHCSTAQVRYLPREIFIVSFIVGLLAFSFCLIHGSRSNDIAVKGRVGVSSEHFPCETRHQLAVPGA
jgi:hypothetical protein